MVESLPEARVVTLRQWEGTAGYGFAVDKNAEKGYFKIKKVSAGTPAASAGPAERDCLVARGYKLNSQSCPLYTVVSRGAADDTTKSVAEKLQLKPFESCLLQENKPCRHCENLPFDLEIPDLFPSTIKSKNAPEVARYQEREDAEGDKRGEKGVTDTK
ncbi:hypothetical protein SprV_0200868900 [Sparganum proliferum]